MTTSAKRKAIAARILGVVLIGSGIALLVPPLYSEVVETQIQSGQQQQQAERLSRQLETKVDESPAKNEPFAVLYVPRLGADFRRPIAEGTGVKEVLNTVGIGHYTGTALPNEVGNFALASHRTTHGGAFNHIDKLVEGDSIFVEFASGWTTYKVVSSEVVSPNEIWVIGSNPLNQPDDKWITFTTCTPRYTSEKRLVVWAKQVGFNSRTDGPPAELTASLR